MSIIAELHNQVKSGKTLQQAIDLVVPGADPEFWEPRLRNYDPNKPKAKRTTRGRTTRSKRSQYFKQQQAINSALLETVKRVNGDSEEEPEARYIPWNVNGEERVLEIDYSPVGKHERDTALPSWVDNRQSLEDFLG